MAEPQQNEVLEDSPSPTAAPTVVDPAAEVLAQLSKSRKYILLAIFTLAQFMDIACYSMVKIFFECLVYAVV
jgi:hypothetical protein